ncbi:hypothetical protein B6V68_25225 [Escherichia coli]|nr:hypothetical protein [Escherichia coli]
MGSCAAPSAKGDDKFITTDYLQQCRILCVITWYHLDHQLWTPQNLTIPVITATWILGLLAEPLMELLNKTMPWHKLLVPEPADESTENSSEISQQ